MTLVDLLGGLEAEAAAETARLEAETRAEAGRILESARAEAQTLREQAALAEEGELQREAEQLRALARLAAAALVREAHEEAFGETLAELSARLEALRESERHPLLLRAVIRESLAARPGATVVLGAPRDERLAGSLLGELGVELQVAASLETAGGVELEQEDGRAVRNTLEERLANAEPTLRLLFGEALAR